MAIKKWSEELIARFEKQGRGKGVGEDYQPWLQFGDFSSRGEARRAMGVKVPRVHHLFSNGEYQFLLCAEWAESVIDIKEQFPLDRARTQTIARDLGIRHPSYPDTHVPTVMTVDFLLSVVDGDEVREVAVDVKTDADAADERGIEKLEIHRTYWQQKAVPHHVVFESSFAPHVWENIELLRAKLPRENESPEDWAKVANMLPTMAAWAKELRGAQLEQPATALCREFEELYGLKVGLGMRILGNLLYERHLPVNLRVPQLFQSSWRELTAPPQPDFAALLKRQWAA